MMKRAAVRAVALVVASEIVRAHNGPPFPIVSERSTGSYRISVWTDPDTTDDGSPGGQFWVRLERASGTGEIPRQTRATVRIRPLDRAGPELSAPAAPVRGDVGNQFAGLVMDHEGRFAVHVVVEGPLGAAAIDAEVDATYDLRPAPYMLVLYAAPFVLVGLLWGRLLIRRGRSR
jgi:hypothetical protein